MARYRIITIIAIILSIYCISSALVKYTPFFNNSSVIDIAASIGVTGLVLKLLTIYLYYAFESSIATKCLQAISAYIKSLISRYKIMLSTVFVFLAIYFITAEGSKFIILPHHISGIILTISILTMFMGLMIIFIHWSFQSNKFIFTTGLIGSLLITYISQDTIPSIISNILTKSEINTLVNVATLIGELLLVLLGFLLFATLSILALSIFIIIKFTIITSHKNHQYNLVAFCTLRDQFLYYFSQKKLEQKRQKKNKKH